MCKNHSHCRGQLTYTVQYSYELCTTEGDQYFIQGSFFSLLSLSSSVRVSVSRSVRVCSPNPCVAVDENSCRANSGLGAMDVQFMCDPDAARAPPNCAADRFPRTWLLLAPDELANDHYPLPLPGAIGNK